MNLPDNKSQSKIKKRPESVKEVETIDNPAVDACLHVPAKALKNVNPTKSDFVCVKCGKTIFFAPETRKNVNVLTLALSIIILFPIIISESVDPLKIGLLALLVLVTAIAIQLFYVKKGHFITKDPSGKKR